MRWLLLPVVALALALPALASGDGNGVRVRLDEFTLEPSRQEVRAGTVRFESSNVGSIDHELLVLRTDLAPDELPLGLEGPALGLAGKLVVGAPHSHASGDHGRQGHHIEPGETRVDTVELAPGNYVLLCSLSGHYQAGQRAALVVR